MKRAITWIAAGFTILLLAGCAGNPGPKTEIQKTDTAAVQVSEESNALADSVTNVIDSARLAIEKSASELDQLLNDLNK